jgi:hypothetical protein
MHFSYAAYTKIKNSKVQDMGIHHYLDQVCYRLRSRVIGLFGEKCCVHTMKVYDPLNSVEEVILN